LKFKKKSGTILLLLKIHTLSLRLLELKLRLSGGIKESFGKLRINLSFVEGNIMKEISLRDLLEAGCHFGHQTTRWHPKMKPFIFTARDGIHIFDLVKTKEGLEAAANFVKATVAEGGQIIFVGTKKQAQEIVKNAAQRVNMPYLTERWVGGLITNWEEIKKRINYLTDLKAKKAEGYFKERTKKENLLIDREIAKLERIFGGVSNLTSVPAAIFVTDGRKEDGALKEARRRGVKTIAIVDTNVDPSNVDFVIPANDDATKSIELIVGVIAEAVEEGRKAKSEKKEVVSEEGQVGTEAGSATEEKKTRPKRIIKKVGKETK